MLTQIMKTGVRGRHNSALNKISARTLEGGTLPRSALRDEPAISSSIVPTATSPHDAKAPCVQLGTFLPKTPCASHTSTTVHSHTPVHSLPHLVMNTGSHDLFLKTVSSPVVSGPLCTRLRD